MKLKVINSGSSGNCYYIEHENQILLLDAGIPIMDIKKGIDFNNSIYKHDYKVALFMHSFAWSFMIMLPILISTTYTIDPVVFLGIFAINLVTHYIVDDLKANYKLINLCQDQCFHLIQIFVTWLVLTA